MLQYFPNITGSLQVTGSVLVSGSITATGGIIVSGSIASASYSSNSELLDNLDSTAFVFTSSFNTYSSSMSSRVTNNESTGSVLTTASASFAVVSSSYSVASGSLSTRVTRIEGNYATTGSNIFTGAQTVCANITSTGTIIAQTLNVQQVTSSIVYSSGSNVFGCLSTDVQQMTGSLRVTGSGNHWIVGGSVGINTTSPDPFGRGDALNVGISATGASDNMALSLNAGASGGRGSQIYMGQGGTRHFTLSSNITETTIGTVTNTPFRINTCDTTRLYVSSSTGNIGIGTTCPTYHLEVRCAASVASCYYAAMFARSTGANDGVGDIIAFGANGVTSIGGIYRAGASSWGIELQTANGNTRMRIDNTGIATFCCQVCMPQLITSPSTTPGALSVISSATSSQCFLTFYDRGSSGNCIVAMMQDANGTNCLGGMLFAVWRKDRNAGMRLSSRNLIGDTLSANEPIMDLTTYAYCDDAMTIKTPTVGASSIAYAFSFNDSLLLSIKTNGNVGIGTCNPCGSSSERTIHLAGNSSTNATIYVSRDTYARTILGTNASGGITGTQSNHSLYIVTNDTTRLFIDNTGIACFACQVCAPILTAYKRLGRPYSQTSSSGGTSIIDTSINNSDFGDGAIWSIAWGGNPNAAGSNYFSSKFGYIGVITGYNGNVVKIISYTQVANFENVGTLCLFPFFWDGTTECTTVCNSYTGCIRFKICGYNSSYPGVGQQVYLTKLIS